MPRSVSRRRDRALRALGPARPTDVVVAARVPILRPAITMSSAIAVPVSIVAGAAVGPIGWWAAIIAVTLTIVGVTATRRRWLVVSGEDVFVTAANRETGWLEVGTRRSDVRTVGPRLGPLVQVDVGGRRVWSHANNIRTVLTGSHGDGRTGTSRRPPRSDAVGRPDGVAVAIRRSWLIVAGGVLAAVLLTLWPMVAGP